MARWRLVASLMMILAAGCAEDQPPACRPVADVACPALYVPTFDNVYANTLAKSCGSTKSACHSDAGMRGGMSFATEAGAYAALLDTDHVRVMPGDPACSLLIVRTNSPGEDYQMPPGDPLSAAERCALIQWVEAGAPGPGQPLPDGGGTP